MKSNARHRTIKGNCTYSIFVGVTNDISTKDIRLVRSNYVAVGGGVFDLPRRIYILFKLCGEFHIL